MLDLELVGEIRDIETFAVGRGIRDLARLNRQHGRARWRKRKGFALVRLEDGCLYEAELHWYEASGIGRREMRVKRLLDD